MGERIRTWLRCHIQRKHIDTTEFEQRRRPVGFGFESRATGRRICVDCGRLMTKDDAYLRMTRPDLYDWH